MGAYSVLEIPECSKLNKFLCHPPAILSAMKELTPKRIAAVVLLVLFHRALVSI